MTRHDELCAGARGVLLDTHGESATYLHGITSTAITAIIERLPAEAVGEPGPKPVYRAWVPQASIAAMTVGADTLTFTDRGTSLTLRVVQFLDTSGVGGWWYLQLR